MVFTILKQEPGQQVPRPFARAATVDEVGAVLALWWQRNAAGAPGPVVAFNCVDSDVAILHHRGVRFWAFTEEAQQ
jgi:hypothetical protein